MNELETRRGNHDIDRIIISMLSHRYRKITGTGGEVNVVWYKPKLFNYLLTLARIFEHIHINIHLTDTRNTQIQGRNLWIAQRIVPCRIWIHDTWRSKERWGDRLNYKVNRAVKDKVSPRKISLQQRCIVALSDSAHIFH